MFTINPYIGDDMILPRKRDLSREAEHLRTLRPSIPEQPALRRKILTPIYWLMLAITLQLAGWGLRRLLYFSPEEERPPPAEDGTV